MKAKIFNDIKMVSHTRKEHQCFGCCEKINIGSIALVFKAVSEKRMDTTYLCVKCGFFLDMYIRKGMKYTLTEGSLKENLIANPIKKMWKEYLYDHEAFNAAYKDILEADPPAAAPIKKNVPIRVPLQKKVFSAITQGRKHFFIPITHVMKIEKFKSGQRLQLVSGIAGENRNGVVSNSWIISAETAIQCLGINKTVIAVRLK